MDLPPGRRLQLIEQIAKALEADEYSKTRTALEVFGIRTSDPSDSWDGGFDGPADYVRSHVARTDSQTLLDLHEYAVGHGSQQRTEWEPGLVRVFCSHLASQKQYIGGFLNYLSRFGFTGFVAHQHITPSVAWRESIEAHLSDCDVVLAFIHRGFYDSPWTAQEVGWVLGRGRPLFSLVFDDSEPLQGFMSARQAVMVGTQTQEVLAKQVYRALAKDDRVSGNLGNAVFRRLISARNYYETITSARLLVTDYPPLTADQAATLEQARRDNESVGQCAVGKPDIEALLRNAQTRNPWLDLDEEPF